MSKSINSHETGRIMPKPLQFETWCTNCKCKFPFDSFDIISKERKEEKETYIEKYTKCPICEKNQWLSKVKR